MGCGASWARSRDRLAREQPRRVRAHAQPLRDSGGVVGLNLYTDFLGGTDTDAVVRHIEHLLDLGGTETLALGGDLDGCDTLGGGVTGIQDYPKLYAALAARGYDEPLLSALFADNWLRVLSDK